MFMWGAYVIAGGGLDIENFIKSPLIYSVSYWIWGGLILCLGAKSIKAPCGDGTDCTSYFPFSLRTV